MMSLPKVFMVGAITLSLHLIIYFSGVIPFFDFRIFDLSSNFKTAPLSSNSGSTVVVEIDEKSLQSLGQWPWPRLVLAKALQEILKQQPAVVGLDIIFPEADRTSPSQIRKFYQQMLGQDIKLTGLSPELEDHDLVLADVLRSGPTVLPVFVSQRHKGMSTCDLSLHQLPINADDLPLPQAGNILCNNPSLQQAASGFGYINAAVDSDGIFRRQSLMIGFEKMVLPNLALAMLAQVDPDLQVTVPQNNRAPLMVSFADKQIAVNSRGEILNLLYPKESFTRISMVQLISGDVPTDLFTGKLVLVGASAAGLYDQYMAPTGGVLPGVFVHAALLENILRGQGIYQPKQSKDLALFFSGLLSLALVWLVFERQYLISWGLYLVAFLASLLVSWWYLERGIYISLGYFLTPFSFLFFIVSLFFAVLHYIERKRFLEDLGAAHSATIDSMTMVAETRDVETGTHIVRTKEYIRLLAEALRRKGYYRDYLTPKIIDLLYRAAPLHDIGKVGIPDVILQKPGKLEDHEFAIMRNHVAIGQSIIENAITNYSKTNEFLSIASNISFSHHEKWDGSGYPLGLEGDAIPLEGRMMALADVYDALISRRCYKEPLSFQDAEQIIRLDAGKHFDPVLVQIFMELQEDFRRIAQQHQERDEIYGSTKLRFGRRISDGTQL